MHGNWSNYSQSSYGNWRGHQAPAASGAAPAAPADTKPATQTAADQSAPPTTQTPDNGHHHHRGDGGSSKNQFIATQNIQNKQTTGAGATPTPTPAVSAATASPPSGSKSSSPSAASSVSGDKVKLFGGSKSGENNIAFDNDSDKDIYMYAQKGLQPGEKDPGGTLFKIPAHGSITADALEDNGLRFQKYTDTLTPDQQAQLDKNGVANGVTAPAKTGTLYESNYVSGSHLSYDDISPLDGANTAMGMSGNGGRTVNFTQADMDGAPVHNADGTVPGLGPSASSTDNAAANPALRDYYNKTSLKADGTRDFYYNSSVGGDADKANVSYTGSVGKVRTTVSVG